MLFHYRTKDKEGNYVDGSLEANDKEDVIKQLEDRGLFVISLAEMEKERVTAGSLADRVRPQDQEEQSKGISKKMIAATVSILVILIIISVLLANRKEYKYQVVKTQNLSQGGYIKKGFKIVIEDDLTQKDIERVAQKVYREKKKTIPEMEEAKFSFYYTHLNIKRDKSVAVVWWNKDRSGKWDIVSSLRRSKKDKKKTKGTGKAVLNKTEFNYGVSAGYNLFIPKGTTLPKAEKIARDNMYILKKEWEGKLKTINMQVFFEEYTIPFYACKWNINEPDDRNPECRFIKD